MSKFLKLTQALGRKLIAAGYSVDEMKRAVDAYEEKLEAQDAEERAPEGMSQRELNDLNLTRAHENKPPLLPAERNAGEPSDQRRDVSAQQLAAIELERAVFGQTSVGADEFANLNLRRAANVDHVEGEHAPRGFNKVKLARINIERASKGEPELLPHPKDRE